MPNTRIKLGWFIPNRVLACVQYQDTLTLDAISGAANQAGELLQSTA